VNIKYNSSLDFSAYFYISTFESFLQAVSHHVSEGEDLAELFAGPAAASPHLHLLVAGRQPYAQHARHSQHHCESHRGRSALSRLHAAAIRTATAAAGHCCTATAAAGHSCTATTKNGRTAAEFLPLATYNNTAQS
jgi:hypothetical protein